MALTAGGKSIRTSVSIRLPDDVAKSLEDFAATIEPLKAIEEYRRDYADYLIALERLNDEDDAVLSDAEMSKLFGSTD